MAQPSPTASTENLPLDAAASPSSALPSVSSRLDLYGRKGGYQVLALSSFLAAILALWFATDVIGNTWDHLRYVALPWYAHELGNEGFGALLLLGAVVMAVGTSYAQPALALSCLGWLAAVLLGFAAMHDATDPQGYWYPGGESNPGIVAALGLLLVVILSGSLFRAFRAIPPSADLLHGIALGASILLLSYSAVLTNIVRSGATPAQHSTPWDEPIAAAQQEYDRTIKNAEDLRRAASGQPDSEITAAQNAYAAAVRNSEAERQSIVARADAAIAAIRAEYAGPIQQVEAARRSASDKVDAKIAALKARYTPAFQRIEAAKDAKLERVLAARVAADQEYQRSIESDPQGWGEFDRSMRKWRLNDIEKEAYEAATNERAFLQTKLDAEIKKIEAERQPALDKADRDLAALKAKYDPLLQNIEGERKASFARLDSALAGMKAQYDLSVRTIEATRATTLAKADVEIAAIKSRYASMINTLERKRNAEIATRDSQFAVSLKGKEHVASVLAITGNLILLGLVLLAAFALGKGFVEESRSVTSTGGNFWSTTTPIQTYTLDDDDDRI